MRIDVQNAERETYDLCIVGSGPAGVILALEYQKLQPKHRVLLVEYGTNPAAPRNHLDDTIHIVEERNHHPAYECTNKMLGGSSATWGGRCVMFDEIDFMPRKIVDGQCTWNADLFHECRQFAGRAADYFECGDARFNLDEIPPFAGSRIADGFQSGDVTDSSIERYSMPTRFGARYRRELESAPAIDLLEGWEAFSFAVASGEGTITKVGLRDFSRARNARITARNVVLAAGGQETTRLLLKNKQVFQKRGGPPPSLGKYYQGHISGKIASVRFTGNPAKTEYGFRRTVEGVYLRRRFQLSQEVMLENDLLNTALWLDNPLYADPGHRNGALSFMYLAMITPVLGKRLAPPAIAQSFTKGKAGGLAQHFWNVIKDLPRSLAIPASIFFRRYCVKRKLPGVFLYSPRNVYALHFHAEQLPLAENRMEIAPDNETVNIHYRISDRDIDSIIRTHELLDDWLRKCKCGELEFWFPKSEIPEAIRAMSRGGIHQCGTTRISTTAEDGVVDGNLKVWGTSNLYVCSSSAFPTSGQANPTFFLGAFAVRLAHHLSSHAER